MTGTHIERFRSPPYLTIDAAAIAASHTPLWLPSEQGCRVGVFPKREEISIGRVRFDIVTLQYKTPSEAEMG
jgi:hypothetical protein